MTQYSVEEALFSITISDRTWWELGIQTICNYSIEGSWFQAATLTGFIFCKKEELWGFSITTSNCHIPLSLLFIVWLVVSHASGSIFGMSKAPS